MKEKVLEVRNISYEYEQNKEVLHDLSFSIFKGEYLSLIGPNGSGKSTLSRILCYLLIPKTGKVIYKNLEINEDNVKELRKHIGIVFQNPDNQFIGATVEDDIAFGLENRNIEYEKMVKLVQKFSAKVGMEKYLKKEPSEISGGQKQRVAIAGILALGLKIIIFDEATSMLDPEGAKSINNLIKELRDEDKELTFINITHNVEETLNSDRVIVLNQGEIVLEGTPNEVFSNEEIKNYGLEVPLIYRIKNGLKEINVNVDENINDFDSLARFICKSK